MEFIRNYYVKSCLLSCALIAGSAQADGSETPSLGVASMLMGSAMIVGGSVEVIAESAAVSAELVVASVVDHQVGEDERL